MGNHVKADGRRAARLAVVPIGCVLGLVMMLSVGGIVWHTSPSLGHSAKAKSRDVGAIPGSVAEPGATSGGSGKGTGKASDSPAPAPGPLSPMRIDIPKLHASAPITNVGTTPDLQLDVPLDPKVVGWWSPGAKPGASKGTAVFAGHINYAGVTGTFADIGELNPGDKIHIHGKFDSSKVRDDTFTVAAVKTYHKTSLPYQEIFDQKVAGRIALVTCGGPFDNATGNYLDNIVVYAVPART